MPDWVSLEPLRGAIPAAACFIEGHQMAKSTLPIEVHDHFRKANVLHGYVQNSLGEASKHAIETGQELLAAKSSVPHGSWEDECNRLFDGSLRTAQFYMQFARDFAKLKNAEKSALLMLEGTLDGAAKAARKAANPEKAKPSSNGASKPKQSEDPPVLTPAAEKVLAEIPEPRREEVLAAAAAPTAKAIREAEKATRPDYGRCPNCAGTKWDEDDDGVCCASCRHPYGEPAGDVDDDRLGTQRAKTVKTVEALQRAFDDLQFLKAKKDHEGVTKWSEADAIATLKDMGVVLGCKALLSIAKGWR